MHLSITTDKGTFKGMADSVKSYGDKKIMVLFFNAELSEKEIILERLKAISNIAQEFIVHFREPKQVFLSEFRFEYLIYAEESVVSSFHKALSDALSTSLIPARYELPFEIWHLVEIGEYFIPIPGIK
jgi:hypothetical protein